MTSEREEFNKLVKKGVLVYDSKCCNCSSKEDLYLHHIVPLILGGKNIQSNLATLCATCHSRIHGQETIITRNLMEQGRKRAIAKGKKMGRNKLLLSDKFNDIFIKYENSEITAEESCKLLDMTRATFFRRVKEYREELGIKTVDKKLNVEKEKTKNRKINVKDVDDFEDVCLLYEASEINTSQAAMELGCSKATFLKHFKEFYKESVNQ